MSLATDKASHLMPWRGKFTWARASSPCPSIDITLPSPNLVWNTFMPARSPCDGDFCTGTWGLAKRALDLGFYVSLSGIVTFKNAKDLQETARRIPDDRLLVETDSPFLAPVPHRGRTCEPAFVADTARFVAGLRGVELETLAEQTTNNFFNLFTKAAE